jgi:hypothetical protein
MLLEQDATNGIVAGICFNNNLKSEVKVLSDWH